MIEPVEFFSSVGGLKFQWKVHPQCRNKLLFGLTGTSVHFHFSRLCLVVSELFAGDRYVLRLRGRAHGAGGEGVLWGDDVASTRICAATSAASRATSRATVTRCGATAAASRAS